MKFGFWFLLGDTCAEVHVDYRLQGCALLRISEHNRPGGAGGGAVVRVAPSLRSYHALFCLKRLRVSVDVLHASDSSVSFVV